MIKVQMIQIIFGIAALLFLWQLIVSVFNLPPYILPSPILVSKSFVEYGGYILVQSISTLGEATLGFLISLFLGMTWALVLSYFRFLRIWFLPLLLISQALPIFVVAPVLVLWLGYGMVSKVIITALMVFFPIASGFYDGLRSTPEDYLDLAQVLGARKIKILLLIRVPAAFPSLANGLRIAAVFAPMGAIIGEWVGATQGLGLLILNANSRMQIDLMFAAILVLVVLTLGFYFIINIIVVRLSRIA